MGWFANARTPAEWQRICDRCGRVWFATTERPPSKLEIRGHKTSASGSRGMIGGGRRASSHEMRAYSLQTTRDAILAQARCPGCGSASYTQLLVNR